jgi:Predicted membrane protein (DUF2207)
VRWLGRALAAFALAAGPLLPAPASAQGGEQILDYRVDLRIQRDGDLLVTERISYDFGAAERHGIFRDLPVRVRHDDANDRVYGVEDIVVQASFGTPDRYVLEDVGRLLRVRIGDPDRTITGRHDYVIDYRVRGALDGFEDHDELYWFAVGTQWPVPIQQASASVTAPAGISHVACNAGPSALPRPCTSSTVDGDEAFFSASGLRRNEGLAVGVGFPTGVVPAPRPLLQERGWHPARAFSATPWTLGMTGGLLLVAMLVLGWLFLVVAGDRRVAVGPGGTAAVAGGAAMAAAGPEGIRPAQAGLLVDGAVEPVAIGATLVDLAARGYLRIEEPGATGNWRLVPLKAADQELLDYERALLDGIFGGAQAESRRLSSLHGQSSGLYKAVRSALYEDAMRRGWFVGRPDRVRTTWATCGAAVAATGAILLVVAASATHLGLLPIPIVLAGLLLWRGARRMPRRTAAGAELTRRVAGFRRYLRTTGSGAVEVAAAGGQLPRYLPYAIVLGLGGRWASPHSADQFARSAASTLSATSPTEGWRRLLRAIFTGWGVSSGGSWSGGSSSGGGSSGGSSGGDGGGGGSW